MKTVIWFLATAALILAVLVNIESDPSLISVTQSTILNRYHSDLFQFVLHPDTVEMWFLWISHFRSADKRPVGVGKQYQAVYSFPFLGDQVLLFQVKKFVPDTCLVLESESLFRPRFEVESSPVSRGEQTRLTFRISFRRSSLLFQYTMGPILQVLARHYIQNSLTFLHSM
ncbi:hypothetical protein R5R35_005254 [Gryllus longicercus]|uniref:Uncharacterized protein n=1 Tax=Gryllus longicercus TaxID=2509291 RepID=A0AAN9VKQ5_9ORTH|nr:Uncharacterized protein GBIM_11159 [Gryllus bimaculatus]